MCKLGDVAQLLSDVIEMCDVEDVIICENVV